MGLWVTSSRSSRHLAAGGVDGTGGGLHGAVAVDGSASVAPPCLAAALEATAWVAATGQPVMPAGAGHACNTRALFIDFMQACAS